MASVVSSVDKINQHFNFSSFQAGGLPINPFCYILTSVDYRQGLIPLLSAEFCKLVKDYGLNYDETNKSWIFPKDHKLVERLSPEKKEQLINHLNRRFNEIKTEIHHPEFTCEEVIGYIDQKNLGYAPSAYFVTRGDVLRCWHHIDLEKAPVQETQKPSVQETKTPSSSWSSIFNKLSFFKNFFLTLSLRFF